MTQIALSRPAVALPAIGSVFAPLVVWYQTYQTRKALNALSDRELLDIGLVRADIDSIAVGN